MQFVYRVFIFISLFNIIIAINAQDDDLRTIEFIVSGDSDYEEVEIDFGADDMSIYFHVVADDPYAYIGLFEIFTPDDEDLYILDELGNIIEFGFIPYTEDNTGELGVFLPAAPQYNLNAGTYIFGFAAEDANIQSITAIIRSGNADARQALDINIWNLSFDSGLDNDTEAANFQGILRDYVDDLLNPHNIQAGDISIFTPDEATMEDYGFPYIDDEDVSSLNEICALMSTQVGATRALNLVLLDGFDEGEDGGTAGVSINAGNAGIIFSVGSRHSCVVASWEAYADDLESQAANIIHESAHFMSLPHTTEEDGATFDIFNDTPECDFDTYSDGEDDFVDDFECGVEGGANNFLFWNGDPEAGLQPYIMSADQAWVMRRHPLFYAVGN